MYLHKLQNVKEQIFLVLKMFDYNFFFSFFYDRTRFELGVSSRGILYSHLYYSNKRFCFLLPSLRIHLSVFSIASTRLKCISCGVIGDCRAELQYTCT